MRITIRRLLLALLLGALFGSTAHAGTYAAASCAESDVASAVAHATNGDTVVIPSCSAGVAWTTTLSVSVGITLQGQGIGNTVLIDSAPKGGSGCSGASPMLAFAVNSPHAFRITGFTLQGGVPDTLICQPGHIAVSGTSTSMRIDHISFSNQQTVAIRTYGALLGVIDHCAFQGSHKQGIIIDHSTWGGSSNGDGSWNAATQLGSVNFIFVEDNTFTDPSAVGAGAIDVFGGGRVVFRHNTAAFIGGHGTESTGRKRGMRAFEVYDNTFTAVQSSQYTGVFIRSGTGVVHDNAFNDDGGNHYTAFISVVNYRDADSFSSWGACDGTGAYDYNSGTVYTSGTHAGASANNVLTDTTKSWTTNQWVGDYAIRNVTKGWGALIASNTSTTITNVGSSFGQSRTWDSGDSYQVLLSYPCIDQVGRGAGILLTGSTPTPTGWVNEVSEPVYQWDNTHNGSGGVNINSRSSHIVVERDYYNSPLAGYKPYTYPHPLTQGTGTNPAPPTNLQIK
jgi:hypothetical protein